MLGRGESVGREQLIIGTHARRYLVCNTMRGGLEDKEAEEEEEGAAVVAVAAERSRATHLAGSQYPTRVSVHQSCQFFTMMT